MIWFALFGLLIITMIAAGAALVVWIVKRTLRRPNTIDSDSAFYPPVQKMGAAPWVIIGMAVGVPLMIVLMTSWIHVDTSQKESRSIPSDEPNPILSETVTKQPDEIQVPVTPAKPETPLEDLNAELEGSTASLLVESVFRAAMNSVNKRRASKEKPASPDVIPGVAKLAAPKSSSAIRSFFKGLLPELPKGIDENEALESFGRYMGRIIKDERKIFNAEKNKPSWLNRPSGFDTKTGAYQTIVTVGPYENELECTRRLDKAIRETVDDYILRHSELGSAAQGRISLSKKDLDSLVKDKYIEPILSSVGRMMNLHVKVIIDPKTQRLIEGKFRESLIFDRIGWSGVALGGITLFLLGALAVLKLDPLYRRRTLITVGIGAILVIGLGLLFVR